MIIWLYGPSGAGKSTLGAMLATLRGIPFVDIDQLVSRSIGMSIEGIFAEEGESRFRELEREAIAACASEWSNDSVVALGAGALHDAATRSLLRTTGLRFFLDIDSSTATERLAYDPVRPLLRTDDPEEAWRRLYESRVNQYRDADLRFHTAGDPATLARQLSDEVDQLLAHAWTRTWSVGGTDCTVTIYRSIATLMQRLGELTGAPDRFFVTDSNVEALYSTAVMAQGAPSSVCSIEPGEEGKSLDSVDRIAEAMVRQGVSREGTMIGLGGGVVTDLAGFVASIYMRGIESVLVPTTLLAQVDAAIGGKTALNVAGVRNLCGSFWQPRHVLISPAFLETLPKRELRSGLVEALKIGIIHEPGLVAEVVSALPSLESGELPERMGEIIRLAVETKFRIVEQDLLDSSIRLSLNFGHTFAHALEAVEAGRFTHGEAVAVGMIAATELAFALGRITESRREDLANLILPLAPSTEGVHDRSRLVQAMHSDKKRSGETLRIILPGEEGGFLIDHVDDPALVETAWKRAFDLVSHYRKELQ